ncbi:unnamed protein product [Toxocara canis]|uniref:Uncharacterized protein n=1 Tax=Toxocara canis TaxID=6265 RepID=A0A183TY16_TOXCA|nr:unnamed protein product [Toxocara canis]
MVTAKFLALAVVILCVALSAQATPQAAYNPSYQGRYYDSRDWSVPDRYDSFEWFGRPYRHSYARRV